jgi:hypothetical protein
VLLVALPDEQRAHLAGRLHHEPATVDQAHPQLDRVDPEAGPGQVEERQRRQHLDVEVGVGEQLLDGPLGHHRGAGHQVEHLAPVGSRLDRGGPDGGHDRGVQLVERGGLLVDGVEVLGLGHGRRRGMTARAEEPARDALDRGEGAGGQEIGAGGPQPGHDDARAGSVASGHRRLSRRAGGRRRWRAASGPRAG